MTLHIEGLRWHDPISVVGAPSRSECYGVVALTHAIARVPRSWGPWHPQRGPLSFSSLPMRMGWKFALGIGVSAFFIWWVLRGVDPAEVITQISQANPWYFLASVFVGTAGYFVRALRWKVLLHPLKPDTALRSRFAGVSIGFAINNLIPARVGELARAFALTRVEPITLSGSVRKFGGGAIPGFHRTRDAVSGADDAPLLSGCRRIPFRDGRRPSQYDVRFARDRPRGSNCAADFPRAHRTAGRATFRPVCPEDGVREWSGRSNLSSRL